ncbi:MAG: protein kinase domain-containing protein, partial [Planctomycetota bacterium]
EQIGSYRVDREIGRGGMGVVYLARDMKLEREAAIKCLPPEVAGDVDRLARFEREAKTLASLNHPNIASIYGLEEVDGERYIILEYVEGETLEERLRSGALPVDEALTMAIQIAEAIEAAHEKGIIHRDLKPANIKLTSSDKAKVLDFGLAKALDEQPSSILDSASSPTMPRGASPTMPGAILGTAGYLSPEQARGKPVDKRTDIFSFGCILYEMLTGLPPFPGETATDSIGATLHKDVRLEELPAETPPIVRHVLARCLERDRNERLRDIGDVRIELSAARRTPFEPDAPTRARSDLPIAILATAILSLAIGAAGAALLLPRLSTPSASPDPADARSIPRHVFTPKTFGQQMIYTARFMPDVERIGYSAALTGNRPEIFLLQPGSMAPRRIAPLGTLLLSVSDGGELAVLTDTTYLNHRVHEGTLARMTIDGAPRALVEMVRDADWGPNGELAIVRRQSGLDRLEYPIGEVLYETTGYVSEPRVSADGSIVAFLDHPFTFDDRGWVKVVDRDGEVRTLTEEYWAIEGLTWAPDGERVHFSAAAIGSSTQVEALSVALDDAEVRREFPTAGDLIVVDSAPDGRWLGLLQEDFYGVAVRPPGGDADVDLSWLDLSWGARFSPDRQTLLFSNGHGGANYSVVTRRIDGSPILTLGEGDARGFSPDGRWAVALIASPPGIALYPTGVGAPRRLERGTLEGVEEVQWFPEGESVLITGNEPARPLRMFRQPISGGPPEPVTPEGIFGSLSPRGDQVLALDSDTTWKLYPIDGGEARAAPGLDESDEVGSWSPDGAAVYVHRSGAVPLRLERVDLETGERTPSISIGPTDTAGLVVIWINDAVLDPDRGYAYNYVRRLSKLFLIDGDR